MSEASGFTFSASQPSASARVSATFGRMAEISSVVMLAVVLLKLVSMCGGGFLFLFLFVILFVILFLILFVIVGDEAARGRGSKNRIKNKNKTMRRHSILKPPSTDRIWPVM